MDDVDYKVIYVNWKPKRKPGSFAKEFFRIKREELEKSIRGEEIKKSGLPKKKKKGRSHIIRYGL